MWIAHQREPLEPRETARCHRLPALANALLAEAPCFYVARWESRSSLALLDRSRPIHWCDSD
jgi:hypothetical protein